MKAKKEVTRNRKEEKICYPPFIVVMAARKAGAVMERFSGPLVWYKNKRMEMNK